MSDHYIISRITVDKTDQQLLITWSDGAESAFPMEGLRRACPCVFCRGGHEHMSRRLDVQELLRKPSRTWEIRKIQPVGNYALQLIWSDGHNTGLYRYDALRNLWEDYCELMKPR